MLLRRSFLNGTQRIAPPARQDALVPGHDLRKLEKCLGTAADTIVLDLEDGVPNSHKAVARSSITGFLRGLVKNRSTEIAVRVNSFVSGLSQQDFGAIKPVLHKVDSIVFPKICTVQDVMAVNQLLQGSSLEAFLSIESPRSLSNLQEILSASERTAGLIFGCEDYCAASGIKRTGNRLELLYARSKIVNYGSPELRSQFYFLAKSADIDAIDMVCLDFRNKATLRAEAEEGNSYGFTGKQVIHPDQIDIVNEAFSPSDQEVGRCRSLLEAYQDFSTRGKGAFEFGGIVVDLPVVEQARRILRRHDAVVRGA